MDLIDTHVHLEDEAFDPDRVAVIEQAGAVGVKTMINAGSTPTANCAAQLLTKEFPGLFAAAGVHPHEFPDLGVEKLADLPGQLCQEKVVALGEIGLDYHVFPDYPPPHPEAQQAAYRSQLRLARIFELPLIIHVREAQADALRLLREQGPFPNAGVFHCYAGGTEFLAECLELGFYIGVGGPVTYPKADALRAALRQAPADRLLLETDAPYLPPQTRRGKRNEPAAIREVAEAVAALRGMSPDTLAAQTSENARRLFKLNPFDSGCFTYAIKDRLYVNLTNRCSSDCTFCPRRVSRRVQEFDLTLQREPLARELITAIGDPKAFREIVFCGFGEPLLRLPTLLDVARAVKARGGRVRVDTNGQAALIHGRDILPDCEGLVDEWSVSLNTADPEQYQRIVRPAGGASAPQAGREVHAGVITFIQQAVQRGFRVTVTAVELPEIDARALPQRAAQLGAHYRGRVPQRLGEPED